MKRILLLFSVVLIYWNSIFSQPFALSGKITDRNTHEPIPFVNILYNNGKQGIIASIDGQFQLTTKTKPTSLAFSIIGYKPVYLNLDTLSSTFLSIEMTSLPTSLDEVVVRPGVNPAHRIIQNVIDNRNRNNPEKMSSFSYRSYNKVSFNFKKETSSLDSMLNKELSDLKKTDNILNKKETPYILLTESVSERKFKYPSKNQEKIIASRVSGFKDPSFTLLATQLQSFSFYNDFIILFDKYYLNPISPGSLSRYSFLLEDTFLTETLDTLYVISFKPNKGRNFEGLKGVLYINTNGFAIQNVIAEAYPPDQRVVVKIQQRYEHIDHRKWFPTQLNTEFAFRNIANDKNTRNLAFIGFGKTYLTDIKLEPDVQDIHFSNIELTVDPNAAKQNDAMWIAHRIIPLTRKDSVTYHVLDSIGNAVNLDQKLEIWETISTGFIPMGYVNLNLRRLFNYNEKEGIRLGLGLQTNKYVSRKFTIGGHYAYGFKDKDKKYGAFIQLFPSWESHTKFVATYLNDVTETGGYRFVDDQFLMSTDLYRNFLINRMDRVKGFETSFTFRILDYFKMNFSLNNFNRRLEGYTYADSKDTYINEFTNTEIGLGLKLAYKEKFVKTPRGRLVSTGTSYPVIWFNYKQGIRFLDGALEYRKYEVKISKTFVTKTFGKNTSSIVAGMADKSLPLNMLYNGHGSFDGFTFDAENSFATMRMNEFYSDAFASWYFRQNFESLLFKKGKFKPEIALAFNAGYGRMNHSGYHQGITFRTMEKGFYETGVVINNLLRQKFLGYGFAVYYRLGPYQFLKTIDNFALKFSLKFNF